MLHGASPDSGAALVQHPDIAAVGFTGSLGAGRALFDLCAARPKPIPFHGELGSINPVFCLPSAVAARGAEIGAGWVASLTMGAGQFCTNPGVLICIDGPDFDTLQTAVADALASAAPQKMLTERICKTYGTAVADLKNRLEVLGGNGSTEADRMGSPVVFRTDAARWRTTPDLHEEVFGASGIVVTCTDRQEMLSVAEELDGQLTATLQLEMPGDGQLASALLPALTEKTGRILCNGFPTGVEVCSAMMHGGPYPASTDSQSTSVGTLAINRWLRPVAYQDLPFELLPSELK